LKIAMYNLTTTCRFGGVETFVWEISRELARRGEEVHIFGGRGKILREIPRVRLRLFPFWPREKIPNLGRRFRKLGERLSMAVLALSPLLGEGYDLLHIHKPFDLPLGWAVRKFKGTKLILGSHGTDFFAGDRLFARGVDASVSCSEYNSRLIAGRYGIKPEVIYNGIDPQVFRPLRFPDRELQRGLSLSGEDKIIIYVGRLIGLKGLKVLLKAVACLKKRSGIKLLIVGDGEDRSSIQELGERLGLSQQILFAGFVPHSELHRYYSLAHIAVFPTLADEAFGISICEAMACGVATVATRVGGIPELIQNGDTGFLTQPGNEMELAEKIQILLADERLRRDMGERASQTVEKNFTWEKVADRLQKAYAHALGGDKP